MSQLIKIGVIVVVFLIDDDAVVFGVVVVVDPRNLSLRPGQNWVSNR